MFSVDQVATNKMIREMGELSMESNSPEEHHNDDDDNLKPIDDAELYEEQDKSN